MAAPDRTAINPLPNTPEGTKMLRGLSSCPIPQLGVKYNNLIQFYLNKKDPVGVDRVCQYLPHIMTADLTCDQNIHSRVVVKMDADDELSSMSQQMAAIALEATAMQERLNAMATEYNSIEDARFAKAAAKYGLNLKERSYRVNEDELTIELVEAGCETCKAKTALQDGLKEFANGTP
jgi:hypothetical protein